ncbi:MAG: hypothetical protein L0Y32_03225 [Nevskiales bacterium]|nr:hypothetical protein [Nevskiales bacterium]
MLRVMPPDARKLSDWLHRQPTTVREALSRSEHLVQVNRAFQDWLRQPWTDAVRLAMLDDTAAVFHADHAAAATVLRFHSPAILAWLRQRYCPACTSIEIKVRPST